MYTIANIISKDKYENLVYKKILSSINIKLKINLMFHVKHFGFNNYTSLV